MRLSLIQPIEPASLLAAGLTASKLAGSMSGSALRPPGNSALPRGLEPELFSQAAGGLSRNK
jgi:hypothetical protein